jgi:hypothetical protein
MSRMSPILDATAQLSAGTPAPPYDRHHQADDRRATWIRSVELSSPPTQPKQRISHDLAAPPTHVAHQPVALSKEREN